MIAGASNLQAGPISIQLNIGCPSVNHQCDSEHCNKGLDMESTSSAARIAVPPAPTSYRAFAGNANAPSAKASGASGACSGDQVAR